MIRIGIIGHKEVPSYNGGIEAVLTEMIPLFNKDEVTLTIYNRWVDFYKPSKWGKKQSYAGFRIIRIPTFKKNFLNAFVYSVLASIHAMFSKYDIVHYHAEGPSAMAFLPRLTGKKIVCTNHGLDWNRGKWGGFASKYLKFGEKMSVKHSDALIVLSEAIKKYFKYTYNKDTVLIRNGININDRLELNIAHDKFDISANKYYLAVGRMVPEKGFHYLISAYSKLNTDIKLVIAGALNKSEYCMELIEQAKDNNNIIFTDFIDGDIKRELFSNCYAYIIPSDLEGMSISLLEALGYGCCVIASDIPENNNIYDRQILFFAKGNIDALYNLLKTARPLSEADKKSQIEFIKTYYNWNHIVDETIYIYRKVMDNEKHTKGNAKKVDVMGD